MTADDPADTLLERRIEIDSTAPLVLLNCSARLAAALAERSPHGVWATHRHVAVVQSTVLHDTGVRVTMLAGHGTYPLGGVVKPATIGIRISRDRRSTLQLLHDAFALLPIGGNCYVAGPGDEGIRPAITQLAAAFGNASVIAYGGGSRVALATKLRTTPDDPTVFADPLLVASRFHRFDATVRDNALTVCSRPGVFGWDGIDAASSMLADVMVIDRSDRVLDLGCGTGVLGTAAALLATSGKVCMIDADTEAIRSAAATLSANHVANGVAIPSDIATAVLDRQFDVVITNPPFHAGKQVDLELPRRFIEHAAHVLRPGGKLFLVANRTLPYERMIQERFGHVATLRQDSHFKVLTANTPT